MFIKRKTRVGKAYAYRMLLSLKTSVTDKKKIFFNYTSMVKLNFIFCNFKKESLLSCFKVVFYCW